MDIADEAALTQVLRGADALFSLSPLVENLVAITRISARAAQAAGVPKVVRASASGAGPQAGIDLGRWHYAAEQAWDATGIPLTVLRPANFMQNFLTYGNPESIRGQGAFYTPIEAQISWVDTRDVARIAATVLLKPGHAGKRYELTGGEALSSNEIAAVFTAALGRPIEARIISEAAASEAMAQAGTPPWLVTLLTQLNAVGKAGYLAAIQPDSANLLGHPPTTFAQFVADHLAKFR